MYQSEKAMQERPKAELGQLHGAFVAYTEVPDREAALAWAKRHPSASYGAVEVRPVWG
jgi:hypothetical protein